jgi:2-phosphoglycerate kinase
MVERVGLATESAKSMSTVAPRLLILAGATGVGKSTAAREIATASGFSRILSTDAIREIMRTCIDVDEDPALHRSSFSRGENGEPVIDWQRTCESVEPGISATIERARREGIDLLIEGVHIVPSDRLLRAWREGGGIAVGILMQVETEEKHREMLKSRDAHSYRRADRYLAGFDRIRRIQDGLQERAKIASWPVVDPSWGSDIDRIKHFLNLAWNEQKRD